MILLLADQVSGSTPEGSEHYTQAHLLFGFERESYLMPAPEQKVVNCPCGAKLLLRWTWSLGSAIYPVRCPDCGAEHRLHATPPIAMGQHAGDIYTQMQWTVFRATEGEFLTSDAPVVRRDPGYTGGLYGGGLMSSTAEVWFPLSKTVCLLIAHDEERKRKFFELFSSGKMKEAEAVRTELPGILGRDITGQFVQAVNHQTIVNADRFVYSAFESDEISALFKGECQNLRIVVS
jgi:hypothetical protein